MVRETGKRGFMERYDRLFTGKNRALIIKIKKKRGNVNISILNYTFI